MNEVNIWLKTPISYTGAVCFSFLALDPSCSFLSRAPKRQHTMALVMATHMVDLAPAPPGFVGE